MTEQRKSRPIRMLDSEWDAFKRLLGTEWLRGEIRSALAAEARRKKAEGKGKEIRG